MPHYSRVIVLVQSRGIKNGTICFPPFFFFLYQERRLSIRDNKKILSLSLIHSDFGKFQRGEKKLINKDSAKKLFSGECGPRHGGGRNTNVLTVSLVLAPH